MLVEKGLSKSGQGINSGEGSGLRALMVPPWLTVLGGGWLGALVRVSEGFGGGDR